MVEESLDHTSFFVRDVVLNNTESTECTVLDELPHDNTDHGFLYANSHGSDDLIKFLEALYNDPFCLANDIKDFDCNKEDGYSLEKSVKQHEESAEQRQLINSIVKGVSIGYYVFVIHTAPATVFSWGIFKVLKEHGVFDSVCNGDITFLGHTPCDAFEVALFSGVLFSTGGKLKLALDGMDLGRGVKFSLTILEKIVTKTVLSTSRLKSKELKIAEPVEFVPNVAHVATSEAVEVAVESILPRPFNKLSYKVLAQLIKRGVKDGIEGNENDSEYMESIIKGGGITFCSVLFPDFKKNPPESYFYGYCLSSVDKMSKQYVVPNEKKNTHT